MKPKKYELLEARIMKKGKTNALLAEKLGIHETTLFKKRTGINDFTINEVRGLAKELDMNSSEIVEAFELE